MIPPPPTDTPEHPDRDETLRRFVAATSGDAGARDREKLEQWVAADESRRAEIAQLASIADDARALAGLYPLPRPRRRPWLLAGFAACAAAAAAVALLPPRLVEAGGHRVAHVELGDGIRAELDAGAALLVPRQPWDHAVTLIRGEAMFDVRHDDSRVFAVQAGNATITDLGTRFLVRHTTQGIGVAVFEGEVEIAAPGTPPGRIAARQATELSAGGALRALPTPDEASETAWRQGRIVFNDRPLSEVAARLSRYSPHPITIGDAAIAGLRVSGTFGINNSQDAVRALEQVLPVRAVQRPDSTILEPATPSRQAPRLIR